MQWNRTFTATLGQDCWTDSVWDDAGRWTASRLKWHRPASGDTVGPWRLGRLNCRQCVGRASSEACMGTEILSPLVPTDIVYVPICPIYFCLHCPMHPAQQNCRFNLIHPRKKLFLSPFHPCLYSSRLTEYGLSCSEKVWINLAANQLTDCAIQSISCPPSSPR